VTAEYLRITACWLAHRRGPPSESDRNARFGDINAYTHYFSHSTRSRFGSSGRVRARPTTEGRTADCLGSRTERRQDDLPLYVSPGHAGAHSDVPHTAWMGCSTKLQSAPDHRSAAAWYDLLSNAL